jgi:predicted RNase H-like HicB family nuclease
MTFTVELKQAEDGRWLVEVLELPGVLTYSQVSNEATAKAQALSWRIGSSTVRLHLSL